MIPKTSFMHLKTGFPASSVRTFAIFVMQRRIANRRSVLSRCKWTLLLVVGAQNSSNSNRLREIGEELKVRSYLIDDAQGLDEEWLDKVKTVGITAGASAPEELVEELIEMLKSLRSVRLETIDGVEENIQFKLPAELTDLDTDTASLHRGTG